MESPCPTSQCPSRMTDITTQTGALHRQHWDLHQKTLVIGILEVSREVQRKAGDGLAHAPSIAEDAKERTFWLGPVSDDKHGLTEWKAITRCTTLFPMHPFLG